LMCGCWIVETLLGLVGFCRLLVSWPAIDRARWFSDVGNHVFFCHCNC
jgi:hypothetical protein